MPCSSPASGPSSSRWPSASSWARPSPTPCARWPPPPARMSDGDLGRAAVLGRRDEIGALAGQFNAMAANLETSFRGAAHRARRAQEVHRGRLARAAHPRHRPGDLQRAAPGQRVERPRGARGVPEGKPGPAREAALDHGEPARPLAPGRGNRLPHHRRPTHAADIVEAALAGFARARARRGSPSRWKPQAPASSSPATATGWRWRSPISSAMP